MTLLLTGGTSGIGWETLKDLINEFDQIILPVRNESKAIKLLSNLPGKDKVHVISMDLSLMKSVQEGCRKILSLTDSIEVLINNAGGMFPAGQLTSEGVDLSFATNHLGHFLLTRELLPILIKGKAKIINVSSEAHWIATNPKSDLGLKKSSNTTSAYAKAKLYNILFTKELKYRFEKDGLTSFALHPGAVRTAFGSETTAITKAIIRVTQLFFISPKAGAQTTLFLARTTSSKLKSGEYYVRKRIKTPSSLARDSKLAADLWQYSEKILADLGR